MESPDLRLYLLGDIAIEFNGRLALAETSLRGQQRLVFAYLLCNHGRPAPRLDLATLLWNEEAPEAWDVALSAILSRLRSTLASAGLGNAVSLSRDPAVTRLALAPGAWIDVEAATAALDIAEGALRRGDLAEAGPHAVIAATILRRPFLTGDAAPWANARREEFRRQLIRSHDCICMIWTGTGEFGLAIEAALHAIELDPLRERSYQLLIQAYAASGNRAEAIKSFQRLRTILADELGIDPSDETQQLYLTLVR